MRNKTDSKKNKYLFVTYLFYSTPKILQAAKVRYKSEEQYEM